MQDIIQKAFSAVSQIANLKNVHLVETPLSNEDAIFLRAIYGDERRILQVIVHFLRNSLKFSNNDS